MSSLPPKKPLYTGKASEAMDARHEAAHAVVAVRLNLPLEYVNIRERKVQKGNAIYTYGGGAMINAEAKAAWFAELPSGQGEERITSWAVEIAAGPVSDQAAGCDPNDLGASVDWEQLLALAYALGVGSYTEVRPWVTRIGVPSEIIGRFRNDPAVRAWLNERTKAARRILHRDGGAAWDRVRLTLERKKYLTGDEVRELIAESDRQNKKG